MAVSQSNIRDTGSNYSFGDKVIKPDIKRSRFDCSYVNYLTAEEGAIYPIYLQFFQPKEDYELSVDAFIRVINPPVVPLLSGQRVFFHYYAVTMPQIWKQFQTFMTKGRNGNVAFRVPTIKSGNKASQLILSHGRGTLFDFLIGSLPKDILDASVSNPDLYCEFEYNALPFMAYQRIFRDYYMNQRLNNNQNMGIEGNVWFPYDDAEFRLDYTLGDSLSYNGSNSSWRIDLTALRYRNYADDYFTSALESPMLGNVDPIEFDISSFSVSTGVEVDNAFKEIYLSAYKTEDGLYPLMQSHQSGTSPASYSFSNIGSASGQGSVNIGSTPSSGLSSSNFDTFTTKIISKLNQDSVRTTLYANQLRDLLVLSHIAEKHARIDGSYSEYIGTFYDKRPRSGQDFRPTYIGGSYQRIQFGEVLQTTENSNSPLGTIGGKGASSNSGWIGRYHSDDYGFIMGLMSIVPDTIYSTGVNRSLLYSVQEDFPLPERNDLGMQPIFKKELLWTGNSDIDDDVWAYQDRFDELRYRANEIHGAFGDSNDLSFSPYTQYRKITSMPTLSQSFVTLGNNNINKDWRSVVNLPPYGCQVYTKALAVKPMPYKAVPIGLL